MVAPLAWVLEFAWRYFLLLFIGFLFVLSAGASFMLCMGIYVSFFALPKLGDISRGMTKNTLKAK